MDTKTIETLSISAVRDSIAMCPYLEQFIDENDKTPAYDGFINVYNDSRNAKKSYSGCVKVQVKGKEETDHSRARIKHLVAIEDLNIYLKDGGCMYYVVYIDPNTAARKIYYLSMTPLRIRDILKKKKKTNQKMITVEFLSFPYNADDKATVFMNCLDHCKKQANYSQIKLPTLEELQEQGCLERIEIPLSGVRAQENPTKAFLCNDTYVYAYVTGNPMPLPIDIIMLDKIIQHEQEGTISVDGKAYYDTYTLTETANTLIARIGQGMTMSFSEGEMRRKINYKVPETLRDYVKDQSFMMDVLEHGGFEIRGKEFRINEDTTDRSNYDLEQQKRNLQYYSDVLKAFEILHCSDDLDITKLNQEDHRMLRILIDAIVYRKPIAGLPADLKPISRLSVSNLKFALSLKKNDNSEYIIEDIHDGRVQFSVMDKEGKHLPIPLSAALRAEDFVELSNLRFEEYLADFKQYGEETYIAEIGNNTLLNLIKAHDKSEGKRKQILFETAIGFADWLLSVPEESLRQNITVLNKLQLVKRLRELSEAERNQLYDIIDDREAREMEIVGAYLLLGEQVQAQRHYQKLTSEEQEAFVRYPIGHFLDIMKES